MHHVLLAASHLSPVSIREIGLGEPYQSQHIPALITQCLLFVAAASPVTIGRSDADGSWNGE